MRIDMLFDWILIISTTLIAIKSYKLLLSRKNSSISNFVILILYVFCVVPIILNYIIGIPKYEVTYWYKPFISPMKNENVNIIYDLYIFITILFLYLFLATKKPKDDLKNENTLTSLYNNNKIISIFLILLPILLIIITGSFKNYLTFNVATSRGFEDIKALKMMTPCLLISVITYFSITFKGKMNIKKVIMSFIYFFVIVWISGKRFMIANILILIVFYITNLDLEEKTRKKFLKYMPILFIMLISFSAFYLIKVRPMKDTSTSGVYEMLRVDFGRDDVIKYVINEELINENRILDYRGETIIGLIGSFIPRKLWTNKPYPHYMYLTSSILGINKLDLPAGTTPCFLEMTICNFGIMGMPIGVLSLLLLCFFADRIKDIDKKGISLIILSVLLTQSMDVYLVLILFYFAMKLLEHMFKNKKIRIVWR